LLRGDARLGEGITIRGGVRFRGLANCLVVVGSRAADCAIGCALGKGAGLGDEDAAIAPLMTAPEAAPAAAVLMNAAAPKWESPSRLGNDTSSLGGPWPITGLAGSNLESGLADVGDVARVGSLVRAGDIASPMALGLQLALLYHDFVGVGTGPGSRGARSWLTIQESVPPPPLGFSGPHESLSNRPSFLIFLPN
jgi:hypothetical protein